MTISFKRWVTHIVLFNATLATFTLSTWPTQRADRQPTTYFEQVVVNVSVQYLRTVVCYVMFVYCHRAIALDSAPWTTTDDIDLYTMAPLSPAIIAIILAVPFPVGWLLAGGTSSEITWHHASIGVCALLVVVLSGVVRQHCRNSVIDKPKRE